MGIKLYKCLPPEIKYLSKNTNKFKSLLRRFHHQNSFYTMDKYLNYKTHFNYKTNIYYFVSFMKF